jgi:hypothetical protein
VFQAVPFTSTDRGYHTSGSPELSGESGDFSISTAREKERAVSDIENLGVATEDSFNAETHLFKGNESSEHFLLFA